MWGLLGCIPIGSARGGSGKWKIGRPIILLYLSRSGTRAERGAQVHYKCGRRGDDWRRAGNRCTKCRLTVPATHSTRPTPRPPQASTRQPRGRVYVYVRSRAVLQFDLPFSSASDAPTPVPASRPAAEAINPKNDTPWGAKFPVIDKDPHFNRVFKFFRPSDYAVWGSVTAAVPGLISFMGACRASCHLASDTSASSFVSVHADHDIFRTEYIDPTHGGTGRRSIVRIGWYGGAAMGFLCAYQRSSCVYSFQLCAAYVSVTNIGARQTASSAGLRMFAR